MAYISWLDAGRWQRHDVGGKGALLAELTAGGFRVPRAFAVNTEGFKSFVARSGLEGESRRRLQSLTPTDAAALRSTAQELQALALQAPLPPELESQVVEAYGELASTLGPACAVRSSATVEDNSASSFAGLFDTFLNIQGAAAVVDSVRRCYASLWSERVLDYYARQGLAPEASMAVLVMQLVPAETSGVVSTAHPVTGALDQVIINSTFGLGEAIVSGLVTPDSFLFEKGSFRLLEATTANKTIGIFPAADAGTEEHELEVSLTGAPSLSEDDARDIARVACEVEQYMGSPQDIEFAIARGDLYLLQSRPITTL